MYSSQLPWRNLYETVLACRQASRLQSQLDDWLRENPGETQWIGELQQRAGLPNRQIADEDLCRLYALSRVTQTLLLSFQKGRAEGTNWPGPGMSRDSFLQFHISLGMQHVEQKQFHPFFHEILEVIPADTADAPIELLAIEWPCLMLGDLLFLRAGCIVSAGSEHLDPIVAQSSRLYWTFRRKDRPRGDHSDGWGSNSQWRTQFRRDYRTSSGYLYNFDGRHSLNDVCQPIDGLPVETWIEIVRHRCMVKSKIDDSDLYPYQYSYCESL